MIKIAYLISIYSGDNLNYFQKSIQSIIGQKLNDNLEIRIYLGIDGSINKEFKDFSSYNIDLFPQNYLIQINEEIEYNYEAINNACYRTGFAKTQEVYEAEVKKLFNELDKLERKLDDRDYLIGNKLTAADLSLLPSLLRFDVAYHGIFKCNLRRLKDYKNISRYIHSLLSNKEIEKTFKKDNIKNLYYKISELNPSGIVPLGQV